MGGPNPCKNDYCDIPQGFIELRHGPPKYVAESDTLEAGKRIPVSAYQLKRTEVTVGEYKAFLARHGRIKLKSSLFWCAGPTQFTFVGRRKESFNTFIARMEKVRIAKHCENMELEQLYLFLPGAKENLRGDDYPVVAITYDEMRAFCQDSGGDLPTSAQLELAALGKSGEDKYGTPLDRAILKKNGFHSTQPVCGPNNERANSLGVCDLAGNVWESALDIYDPACRDVQTRWMVRDPYCPLTKRDDRNLRSVEMRGGSYDSFTDSAHSASVDYTSSYGRALDIGFRCARPTPSDNQHERRRPLDEK